MKGKFAQVLAAVILCTISVSGAAAQTIDVVGLDGRRVSIALDGLERRTIITADRGLKTTHEGVALRDVLIKAGVPLGDALKGQALARVVVASAPDGYRVALAIAEIDAAFNEHLILIADKRNGQPLLADSGPLQLVVPQDKRPARWVRQVAALEVRQLP